MLASFFCAGDSFGIILCDIRRRVAMKILGSGLILFLFAIGAAAQTAPTWPDVTVLENKWRMEVRNPAVEKDPFAANNQQMQQEQAVKRAAIENDNRVKQGEMALPPVVQQPRNETGHSKLSVDYVYELKVKNNGPKEIRMLIWECLFFQPGTTEEVGRRRFVSQVSIKPGATKHIMLSSPKSPTGSRTVDASKAGKKPNEMYSEQVVIRNIGYADGTNWPAPRGR